ncbi:hypothetical protein V22_06610 [Calycomorphotria hydatis]|uniref:Nickel uptake substrate-specific transmembrane region n=2 Tax=Calycomorphotria hydatis TaxID=2528027 RepID=A0A517T4Z7_9PLAN|nr:hypothetical protein V22_06610 [Calycomorphotria hydatis]
MILAHSIVCLSAISGCSQQETFLVVPVSGKVLLDGKPLSNMTVYFNPKEFVEEDSVVAGWPSSGTTDEEGKYVLMVARKGGGRGAMPGTHRVTITDNTVDVDKPSRVPERQLQGLEFVVPPDGTESADFFLTSKK